VEVVVVDQFQDIILEVEEELEVLENPFLVLPLGQQVQLQILQMQDQFQFKVIQLQ
jgi:hypothetical protein